MERSWIQAPQHLHHGSLFLWTQIHQVWASSRKQERTYSKWAELSFQYRGFDISWFESLSSSYALSWRKGFQNGSFKCSIPSLAISYWKRSQNWARGTHPTTINPYWTTKSNGITNQDQRELCRRLSHQNSRFKHSESQLDQGKQLLGLEEGDTSCKYSKEAYEESLNWAFGRGTKHRQATNRQEKEESQVCRSRREWGQWKWCIKWQWAIWRQSWGWCHHEAHSKEARKEEVHQRSWREEKEACATSWKEGG